MSEEQRNNPLHGVKLEALLTELVSYYGFDILAEQININCFKSNPSIQSSLKFLRKTPWARNKVEAFYLYKFKQLPRPSDTEHELQPGQRSIPLEQIPGNPAQIRKGDKEFFDDPASGPANSKKGKRNNSGLDTQSSSKIKSPSSKRTPTKTIKPPSTADHQEGNTDVSHEAADPWGKWRKKNGNDTET
jgi:uncharacterized protein (DUF2132 family)